MRLLFVRANSVNTKHFRFYILSEKKRLQIVAEVAHRWTLALLCLLIAPIYVAAESGQKIRFETIHF